MDFLPDSSSAIRLSLHVGLWCVLLGAPIAIFFGWVLARKNFFGKSVVGTLLLGPLVTPPVVTGLLLLKMFGRSKPLGMALAKLGISIPFSFAGVVLAAVAMGLPLYVITIRNAFEAIDPRYEELAESLGHSRARVFLKVTLPLAVPGILAGAMLAFARALGEFGATIVLAGNIEGQTRTIPLALFTLLESPDGEKYCGMLLAGSLALALGTLFFYDLVTRYQRRRLEIDHGA
jgi:molybdate transport system permease protein